MARMVVTAPEYTKAKYNLPMLKEIDEYVASVVEVNIPVSTFKHCIIHIIKTKLMFLSQSSPIQLLGFARSRTRLEFTLRVGIE